MRPKHPFHPEILGQEVQSIGDILVEGSDLAVALIASNFLDECLRSLLAAHLRPGGTSEDLLKPGRGLLASYCARADLAYALGLIDNHALKALRKIGEIRNVFAHSYAETTFSQPDIEKVCSDLDYTYELFVNQACGDGNSAKTKENLDKFFHLNNRNRFTYTCVVVGQTIMLAAQKASDNAASKWGKRLEGA